MEYDKIKRLPVTPKPRAGETYLKLVISWERSRCEHVGPGFIVDESLLTVTCRGCGEKLNPVWALARLAERETLWNRSREAYIAESKAIQERRRVRCVHCKQITPIRIRK